MFFSIAIESVPTCICGWRTEKRICTDHRTSLRSTVELGSEIGVNEFTELGAVLHVVGSIPPYSPKLGERRPFFVVGLKLDKVNKIAGDTVIRDGLLTEDGFIVVL